MGVGLKVAALLIALMKGVFCQTWEVTMPRNIVGISDSCVTVPCRFQVPLQEEKNILNCTNGGVWKKGDLYGPTLLNSRNPYAAILKGRTEGDVTRKNCTTTFNIFPANLSDFYYFRLDCLNEPKFSFQTGVQISVKPDPPPPMMIPAGEVLAGAQVRLQCSVLVPCSILPPSITWLPWDSSWQVETQMQQLNVKKQMSLMSTLTFTASADHHNQIITCSASYLLTKGGNTRLASATQRLNILYAPKPFEAKLSKPGPVSEGDTVTLTCSSEANPPVSRYTWYRVHTGNMTKMSEGEFLVLKVKRSSEGVYLCEAQNQQGSRRSTPVTLEVTTSTGSTDSFVVFYILCGLLLVVCILIVVVGVNKYQSLSRRLKQVELKGEHTYADLRTCSVSPDYDKLQPQKPKTTSPPDVPNYENLRKSPRPPVSKPGRELDPKDGAEV